MVSSHFWLCACIALLAIASVAPLQEVRISECKVVIAGGTMEALAAAISSAQNRVVTCLIEPLRWVGGQLTTEGVPALDYAWLGQTGLDMSHLVHQKENQPKNFYEQIYTNKNSSTGRCWVSSNCYLPNVLMDYTLTAMIQQLPDYYLQVFYETTVKRVRLSADNSTILELEGIYRIPSNTAECRHLSDEIEDWYSEADSSYYRKTRYVFQSASVFVDGSQFGDILATSAAPYLQGVDEKFDGDVRGEGNDQCGQSTVFTFAEMAVPSSAEAPYPIPTPNMYNFTTYSQQQIWTYRRLWANGSSSSEFQLGDISLQNWQPGNDFPYGYLFLSKKDAQRQVESNDWLGGVNVTVLQQAEAYALGWHQYFKSHSPNPKQVVLLKGTDSTMGTCHGLSMLPYLRESRRSIGLDDFVIKISDLTGKYEEPSKMTGTVFDDRVAIGNYNTDLHKLVSCEYPDYIKYFSQYAPLPFFLPFRAMTNKKISNLIVTGRLMAQSFLSNSATRVHPVMWAAGTASGVCAAYMANTGVASTRELLNDIKYVQDIIKNFQPIQWTIKGQLYPPNQPGETAETQ